MSKFVPTDKAGEVLLAGQTVRATGDNDEWFFSDGTGEIIVDFPSSNIPSLRQPIYVLGTVASSEVDASDWEPIP